MSNYRTLWIARRGYTGLVERKPDALHCILSDPSGKGSGASVESCLSYFRTQENILHSYYIPLVLEDFSASLAWVDNAIVYGIPDAFSVLGCTVKEFKEHLCSFYGLREWDNFINGPTPAYFNFLGGRNGIA